MNNLVLVCKSKSLFAIVLLFLIIGKSEGQENVQYDLSYFAVDLSSNSVIANKNVEKPIIPASLMKLVTTATWLEINDINYKFETSFYINGKVENGVLNGDIIIKAGNDATLGSSLFKETNYLKQLEFLKNSFNNKGIYSINGSVIVDLSSMPPPYQPAGRISEDVGNYYAAVPQPLSWRDNIISIELSSPKESGKLCNVVSVYPKVDDINFNSFVLSADNNKDSAYIFIGENKNSFDIRGSIPKSRSSFVIKGVHPLPHKQFVNDFLTTFDNNNIENVEYVYKSVDYNSFNKLTVIKSPNAIDIISVINQKSNNLFADNLFISLSDSEYPWQRWQNSSQIVSDFWKNKGVNTEIIIYDGSGLSPNNRLTTHFLVDILTFVYNSDNYSSFKHSLAEAAVSGTLKNWQNKNVKGKIFAKSGSMQGVMGYAGYLYSKSGNVIAFAIVANNFREPTREIQKQLQQIVEQWIDK